MIIKNSTMIFVTDAGKEGKYENAQFFMQHLSYRKLHYTFDSFCEIFTGIQDIRHMYISYITIII